MLHSYFTSTSTNEKAPKQAWSTVLAEVEKKAEEIKGGEKIDTAIDSLLASTKLTTEAKEEIKKIAQEAAKEAGDEKNSSLKIIFALATSLAAAYIGKPYCAAATREIYDALYNQLLGIPKKYQPSYWLVYLPNREHASKLAYDWGPYLLGAIAGPTAYAVTSIPTAISSCVSKTLTAYEATKDKLEQYLSVKEKNNATLNADEIQSIVDSFENIKEEDAKVEVEAEDQCSKELPEWTFIRREPLTFTAKTQLPRSESLDKVNLVADQSSNHKRALSL